MKKIILLLLSVFPIHAYSITYHSGDTLYVWNVRGTSLMAGPSASSDTIALLKLGTSLKIIDEHPGKYPCEERINDKIKLKGFRVQVKTGDKIGYVFDGDIYKINPFPVNELKNKNTLSLINRVLGAKLGFKVVTKKEKVGEDSAEYEVEYKITFFQNGQETVSSFDGCDDDDYLFYNLKFAGAYHLAMLAESFSIIVDSKNKGDSTVLETPVFDNVWDGVYVFDGLDGQISISKGKKGMRISFSLCD